MHLIQNFHKRKEEMNQFWRNISIFQLNVYRSSCSARSEIQRWDMCCSCDSEKKNERLAFEGIRKPPKLLQRSPRWDDELKE